MVQAVTHSQAHSLPVPLSQQLPGQTQPQRAAAAVLIGCRWAVVHLSAAQDMAVYLHTVQDM